MPIHEVECDISDFTYHEVVENAFERIAITTRHLKQNHLEKVMKSIAEQFIKEMTDDHYIKWAKAFADAAKKETRGYIITPEFNTLDTEIKITEFANSIGAKIEIL